MKLSWRVLVGLTWAIAGCASPPPFAGAERGASYSVEAFERAVIAEKIAMLESELRLLQRPEPTDSDEVQLTPFVLRQFPRLSEWRRLKQKARAGDEIWEYHHRRYLQQYDGPAEFMKRGYALVRDGRPIDFVFVDGASHLDY